MPKRWANGRKRQHPCRRDGCTELAVHRGHFCSRSCARTWWLLTKQTPEQRSAQMRKARLQSCQQAINRMLQRVKVLADSEDQRIILAWRYGKQAAKTARYRERNSRVGVAVGVTGS